MSAMASFETILGLIAIIRALYEKEEQYQEYLFESWVYSREDEGR